MRVLKVVALTAALLAVAGCGASGDADAHYSLDGTKSCLGAQRLSSYASLFFKTSEGSIAFDTSEGDEVVLAFGRDREEVEGMKDTFRRLGTVFGDDSDAADVDSYVHVKGNVAYWTTEGDLDNVEDRIHDCLERSLET
jgi:hypothetical protein